MSDYYNQERSQGGEAGGYQSGGGQQQQYGGQQQQYGGQQQQYGGQQQQHGGQQQNYERPQPNPDEAAEYASRHAGGEDKGLFSSIISQFSGGNEGPAEDHEVEQAANVHQQIYNQSPQGQPSEQHSSSDIGSAAAMQAMKMFSGGGGSGGGGSSELIGLAMGEASKLFNAQGGGGDKNAMLASAGQMAMKLYMKQQLGGGGGGGLGSIMGMLGGGGSSGGGGGGMASSLIGKLL